MTGGRPVQYNQRHTYTSSTERDLYVQFEKACRDQGLDMAMVLTKAMRDFVLTSTPINSKITAYLQGKLDKIDEDCVRERSFGPQPLAPIPKMVTYLHSLELADASRWQGWSKSIYNISKQVVQNRKNGIKPTLGQKPEQLP